MICNRFFIHNYIKIMRFDTWNILKQYLLITIFLFLGITNCQAQEHMKFLGVSMDSSLSSFTQEMTKKGFRYIENIDQNSVHMKGGSFAGKENANLIISATQKTKRVAVALVWFNDYSSDDFISNAFKQFIFLFQRKYGDYEKVLQGDTYVYKFDAGTGPIGLYMNPISYGQMSGCFFRYSDAINCSIAIEELSEGI